MYYRARRCDENGAGWVVNLPPEEYASQLRERIGIAQTETVDLQLVAQHFGVAIVEDSIDADGLLLALPDRSYEILIPEATPERPLSTMTFAIAHEIGHFILRKQQETSPRSGRLTRLKEEEDWCDTFAASLLMPETLLRRDIPSETTLFRRNAIDPLPSRYGVSAEFLLLRIQQVYRGVVVYEVSRDSGKILDVFPTFEDTAQLRVRLKPMIEADLATASNRPLLAPVEARVNNGLRIALGFFSA